jgi:proteasome assembly chaperone (PAC2) family protein
MNVGHTDWRNPFLVAAFGGWGDAADVASTAATFLLQNREARRVAEADSEEYFVYSETRPHVRLDEGGQRKVSWPVITLTAGVGGTRDAVVLVGPEPQLRWRRFARNIVDMWKEHGKGGPVVLLGAFLAGVPHNGPVVLTGFATTPELRGQLETLGVQPSAYQGPTSIHSVLAEAFAAEGIPCLSVWAAVPHYLGNLPNPKVVAAMLRCVEKVLGLDLDFEVLDDAARTFEKQIGLAMARSGQNAQPGAIELQAQSEPQPADAEPLPPAEELVEGVEEFLRRNKPS